MNPVRAFSAINSVIPASIPRTSELAQPVSGLTASTKPYSFQAAHRRWSAPYRIPVLRIRRRNSPKIFRIIRKSLRQLQTPQFVNLRRHDRVREIIGIFIMLPAKIKPGMRILMREKWGMRSHVGNLIEFESRSLPLIPYRWRQRMGTRREPE